MKLKATKLDWKGKALKLRSIVLSGAPLVEIDREALDTFDFMRKALRDEVTVELPEGSRTFVITQIRYRT